MAAETIDLEITLQTMAAEKQNWKGQTLNILFQMEPEILEEIFEAIQIRERKIIVFVEGRKPS